MNKVTTINLNGRAYQLEEGGEAVLRKYLETAAAKLADNPDKDEIMADFEQAIADKFDQKLNGHKNVVTEREIEEIIAAMGSVEGAEESKAEEPMSEPKENPGAPKRLYRIPRGEWLMGVCNGLAAYFNIDVTLIRIVFVLLTLVTHAFWIIAYIVLAVVMPPVRTEEQFAKAHGWSSARPPLNANDFIEATKKRYAEWRAELEKMHEEHKAKMAAEHGWGNGTKQASAADGAATATASASASTVKEDIHKWKHDFKKEMREKKQQMKHQINSQWRAQQREWRDEWRQDRRGWRDDRHGAGYDISRAIFGFFAVVVSIVLLAVGVAWALSLYTLVKYGTVFGYALGRDAGHPLSLSIVFLCAAFYVIASPFRSLLQHAWGSAHYESGWREFVRAVVFFVMLAILIYTARELFPQVNAAWSVGTAWLRARI